MPQVRRLAGQVDGDAVMIWAPDADRAVGLASDAVRDVGTSSELLPVRVGVHSGPAVMHGLDWYGSTVNVAARLADEAEPNQALISNATLSAATNVLARAPRVRRDLVRKEWRSQLWLGG